MRSLSFHRPRARVNHDALSPAERHQINVSVRALAGVQASPPAALTTTSARSEWHGQRAVDHLIAAVRNLQRGGFAVPVDDVLRALTVTARAIDTCRRDNDQ